MNHIIFLCSVLAIFTITGCSNKSNVNKDDNLGKIEYQQTKVDNDIESDSFMEEFEEELKLERKSDPLSGYNRVMTNFNDNVYEYVLTPVSDGYKYVVHKEIRISVRNFFHNILYPVRLVNNLLQGKVQNSLDETGRFLVNSTFGLLGLFDPAKKYLHIKPHNEDFGQTLGYYGVGAGPHIVLPFFGPSNLRDLLSRYPDFLVNPVAYRDERSYNLTNHYSQSLLLNGYERINNISLNNNQYEKIKKDAIDLYPYLRDVYEQYREQQIKD